MALSLTPKAASQVKAVLAKEGRPEGFLRLKVASGGCSGMSYEFEFGSELGPKDLAFESNGAKVVADPASHFYLNGSTIDYVQTLMRSGFEIKNPNAQTSCNCGTSFSV